jgi:hypothetical protein
LIRLRAFSAVKPFTVRPPITNANRSTIDMADKDRTGKTFIIIHGQVIQAIGRQYIVSFGADLIDIRYTLTLCMLFR